MQYALIKNNVVENIAVGDEDWATAIASDWQFVVDVTDMVSLPGLNWTYNGSTFTAPVYIPDPIVPVDINWKITKFAFRSRFTLSEKVAIELASLDNPTGTQEQRTRSAMVRTIQKDVDAATYIDLKNQDTRTGVQALETAGLISVGRSNQILNVEPTINEN